MSILDMDVTARRDPAYIRSREFARVRKGYDPDQVRDFLHQLAGWFDDLETDLASARAEHLIRPAPEVVERPVDPYSALGERVAEVLRAAEQNAERVRTESEETANRVLDEARRESVRLRERAQQEADAVHRSAQDEADRVTQEASRALDAARLEAERMLAGLAERRDMLSAELHATRTRLMGIVSRLEEDTGEGDPFAGLPGIAADDPRRDPLLPEIRDFVPPTPPKARTVVETDTRHDEAPPTDATESDAATDVAAVTGETRVVGDDPVAATEQAGPTTSHEDTDTTEDEPSHGPGASHVAEGDDVALAIEDSEAPEDEGTPATGEGEQRAPFSMWTLEEQIEEPGPSLDLSFPDFGPIDIPSLEDDDERS